jgi:uncharacterized protein (TIGR03437 family)
LKSVSNSRTFARNMAVSTVALLLLVLILAITLPRIINSNVSAQAVTDKVISVAVEQQIRALVEEKNSRSVVQQKIDSQLLYAMKMYRGEEIAPGINQITVNVETDSNGRTDVDITGNVRSNLTEELFALGAEIIATYPNYNSVRATVPLAELEAIAALPEVRFVQPKQEPQYLGYAARARAEGRTVGVELPPGFASRASKVRSFISEALNSVWPFDAKSPMVGSKQSEGDATHKAINARTTFGANGSGVRVGVISNGVVSLAASQTAGDLPSDVVVLPGYTGSSDEGTAMLEIVHDVAPGAKLYFATANGGSAGFAQAIRDLRTAGCDIIVDDIIFIAESPFQDGLTAGSTTNSNVIWQAVNDVTAAGTLYFSSAGNEGNKSDGSSGTYQGDFVDGGTLPQAPGGTVHDFGGGTQFDTITLGGTFGSLFWTDPIGGSSNDYDLFILNSTGTSVVSSSTNIQSGSQDPFEGVGSVATGNRVVILKKTGAANRFLYFENFRGRLSTSTEGNLRGHACAANAFAVAATPASNPIGVPPNPTGPFPNPFNASNRIEIFSSDGPRRLFFASSGAQLTPGNVSSTGGILRQKPDITAADGVSVTGVGGFGSPFYGTSAAAPHAAAIAALLRSANPSLTPAQVRTALTSTAIDIEAGGVDRDAGAGIVMAFEALQSIGAAPAPNVQSGAVTVAEVGGNGNGFVDPGESGTMSVQLLNTGPLPANSVTAALSTTTPGVTITTVNSAYPNLVANTGSGTNTSLFAFSMSASAACPLRTDFVLTVTYAGSGSPKVLPVAFRTSPPPVTITSILDTVAPTSGPGFTAITGLQTARLNRNATPTTCGGPKPCPGTTGEGTRRFDAYTFTNCSTTTRCIDTSLFSACSGGLFVAAYLGTFNPNDLCANYLGDIGSSPGATPLDYGFTVPAGATFTIVVSEVTADVGTGCGYTLNIDGLCCQGSIGSCPTVSGVNPVAAALGSSVTISGSNLNAVTGVTFPNGIGASYSINGSSQILATIPSGAATGPIALSKPGCASVQTPSLLVATGTPSSLFVDDGSIETSIRAGGAFERYVNRLTPFSYPSVLTGVNAFFSESGLPVGSPVTILVGKNPGGGENIDSVPLLTLSTTIKAVNQFVTYNFPATTLDSGDFVVGFQLASGATQFSAGVDRTLPSKRRSYFTTNGATYTRLDSTTAAGNLGIRARIGTAACATVTSIDPTSAGVGTQVTINGTNFEGILAVKFANNVISDFTVPTNNTISATVPASALTGPITITKPNCTDIVTPSLTILPCPAVTGISSTVGLVGSQLTITGINFTGVTSVLFTNNVSASFTVNNATQITTTVPAGAATGPITLVKTGCLSAQSSAFTVAGVVATVSAASFVPGPVAAESIVAGFGANFSTNTVSGGTIPLPTELAGTMIIVKDSTSVERPAGMFFVSPGQANFQIPPGTADGTATITVKSGNGAQSIGTVQIVRVAPGLFCANASGVGVAAAQIFRIKQNGDRGFEEVSQFDPAMNKFVVLPIDMGPATDQVFLVLYGVGIRFRFSLSAVTTQIGGTSLDALYAGSAPDFVGLDQVNVALPRSLIGRGLMNVALSADSKNANVATISVK